MSQNESMSATLDGFQQKLDELRWRIDSLPVKQRPHLHKLANVVEQQHRRRPPGPPTIRDMMTDLRLLEKYVKADAKAAHRRAHDSRLLQCSWS